MVHLMVPPTLIVVTGVPLTSSFHLKSDPVTAAVLGVAGVGVCVGVVGVTVAVATAGVASFGFRLCWVQEIEPRSKAVIAANPRILSMVFSPSFSALVKPARFVGLLVTSAPIEGGG